MHAEKALLIDPNQRYAVIGLGQTGVSVLRWLRSYGVSDVVALDTRRVSQDFAALQAEFAALEQYQFFDGLQIDAFEPSEIDVFIVSPGFDLHQAPLAQWIVDRPVWGDIDLFGRYVAQEKLPIRCVGITGSNGKSTVAEMLAHALKETGVNAVAAGNIGVAVLDVLGRSLLPEVLVIELSSFQLESTSALQLEVATLLNLSPDHLDRHGSMHAYGKIKQRIFANTTKAVVNRDDVESCLLTPGGLAAVDFSLVNPDAVYHFDAETNELLRRDEVMITADWLPFEGKHNISNALATMALGEQLGYAPEEIARGLTSFVSLPHRMTLVAEAAGVKWINDSKATNVASAIAAISSYAHGVHWIIGGQSKGQDMSPLAASEVVERCASINLIGDAAEQLELAFQESDAIDAVYLKKHLSLEAAIKSITVMAKAGDVVLLSPACASFDQFENFQARGNAFAKLAQTYSANIR